MTSPLLPRINRFLKESGLPPTLFGRMAVRDPRLVDDLRNGREPGRRVCDRIEYFIQHWRAERRPCELAGDGQAAGGQAAHGQAADKQAADERAAGGQRAGECGKC